MATQRPAEIPWPLSTAPGATVQESAGRLINCYAEPLGEAQAGIGGRGGKGPAIVWRGCPGFTPFALAGQTGYRGGLIVNNLSYECYLNNASTVDANGVVASLGNFPGSKKVSIARNQAAAPNVVAVDIDNGAFTLSGGGAPVGYNGLCASGINALTQNANTFTTCTAKGSGALLRPIAYAGLLLAFTTASIEVYQDTAQPFPAFPYSRLQVLSVGLLQANAIAGFEESFDELMWVAQDFGVYKMAKDSIGYDKVSPPDLDRLIEAQNRLGATLEAYCYIVQGKKFWGLSCPDWTWEFK